MEKQRIILSFLEEPFSLPSLSVVCATAKTWEDKSLVCPSVQRLTILSPNVVNKELGKVVSKVVYVFWK